MSNARYGYEFQGSLVKATKRRDASSPSTGGRRSSVTEFSRKSRKRLMEKIARMNIVKSVFLTLTYPSNQNSAGVAKKHLRAFLERVRRKFTAQVMVDLGGGRFAVEQGDCKVSGVWRIEYQKRGAAHFHLILFNLPYWDKENVQETWGEVIGEDRPFTRIELIHSRRKLVNYMSKYVAKLPDSEPLDQVGKARKKAQGAAWDWRGESVVTADEAPPERLGVVPVAAEISNDTRIENRRIAEIRMRHLGAVLALDADLPPLWAARDSELGRDPDAGAIDPGAAAPKVDSEAVNSGFNTLPYLHAGRWWGVFNSGKLPLADLFLVDGQGSEADDWVFVQMKRYARRFRRRRTLPGFGFTVFTPAQQWLKMLGVLMNERYGKALHGVQWREIEREAVERPPNKTEIPLYQWHEFQGEQWRETEPYAVMGWREYREATREHARRSGSINKRY